MRMVDGLERSSGYCTSGTEGDSATKLVGTESARFLSAKDDDGHMVPPRAAVELPLIAFRRVARGSDFLRKQSGKWRPRGACAGISLAFQRVCTGVMFAQTGAAGFLVRQHHAEHNGRPCRQERSRRIPPGTQRAARQPRVPHRPGGHSAGADRISTGARDDESPTNDDRPRRAAVAHAGCCARRHRRFDPCVRGLREIQPAITWKSEDVTPGAAVRPRTAVARSCIPMAVPRILAN